LLDQGADIITQHTDSPAAVQIASDAAHWPSPGLRHDQVRPETQLTSIIDNWAPYYIERVKAELAGTWKSEDKWGGIETRCS